MRKASANKRESGKEIISTEEFVDAVEVATRRVLSEELSVFEARLDTKLDTKMDAKFLEQRKEYERYAGALYENFQSSLAAVTEMVASTAEDMSSIKEWIREDHSRIHSQIDFRLNALEASTSQA